MGWMKGMRGIISLSNWKEGTVIYQDGEVCGNHGLEKNIKNLAFRYIKFKVLIRYPKGE